MATSEEAAASIRVTRRERLLTIKLDNGHGVDSEAVRISYVLPGVRVDRSRKHAIDVSDACVVFLPESLYGEDGSVVVRLKRDERRHILRLSKMEREIHPSDPILEDLVARARSRKKSKKLQVPKKKGHGSPKNHSARCEKQDDDLPGPPTEIKSKGGLAAK